MCGVAFAVDDYTALIRTTTTSRYGNKRIEVHWQCVTKVTA